MNQYFKPNVALMLVSHEAKCKDSSCSCFRCCRKKVKMVDLCESRRGCGLILMEKVLMNTVGTSLPLHSSLIITKTSKNRFFSSHECNRKPFRSQWPRRHQRRLLALRTDGALETQKHGFQVQKLRMSLLPAVSLTPLICSVIAAVTVQRH